MKSGNKYIGAAIYNTKWNEDNSSWMKERAVQDNLSKIISSTYKSHVYVAIIADWKGKLGMTLYSLEQI